MNTKTPKDKNELKNLEEMLSDIRRPNTIQVNGETLIYCPSSETWVLGTDVTLPDPKTHKVSVIESFKTLILETARRMENTTGDFMTVLMTSNGGCFWPDENNHKNPAVHEFVRQESEQLRALRKILNGKYNHVDFLRLLASIRPSIQDFIPLYSQVRMIQVERGAKIESNPKLTEGGQGFKWALTVQAKAGQQQAAFPSSFLVRVPLTSFGEQFIEEEVEIEVWAEETKLFFSFSCPTLAVAVEEAIKREVEGFRAEIAGKLPALCVLFDC